MGLRPLEIFLLLQCGDRLYSSESDVYRRQILTTKVYPRAVRANPLSAGSRFLIRLISCLNHSYLELNCLNSKIFKCLFSNLIDITNFHPLEVVGRGSKTQLQVGAIFFKLRAIRVKGTGPG